MNVVFIAANNPETIRMINAISRIQPNLNVLGFLDNDSNKIGTFFYGYKVLSGTVNIDINLIKNALFVNLITGSLIARYTTTKDILNQGGKLFNFIHPSVNTEMVEIGLGNYIQENVVLQAGVKIGDNSSIHIGSLIGHEAKIGNSSFIAHGCNLSGFTKIENGVFIGAGVTTVPRVTIGKWSTIGAGAVVTKDIPPYSIAVGNPAKVIKTIDPIQLDGDIF
jgi:sugar O-acyltransferase (sialic acid O-acetyltransferase NeuD family)